MSAMEQLIPTILKLIEWLQVAFTHIAEIGGVIASFLANLLNLILTYVKSTGADNKDALPERKRRCTHNIQDDEHFNELVEEHNCCCSAGRMGATVSDPFTELFSKQITITVPVVFHLVDPKLSSSTIAHWSNHINNNILKQLNDDYNRTKDNYQNVYEAGAKQLFSQADKTKLDYYVGLSKVLPHTVNFKWEFVLDRVVIKPTTGVSISVSSTTNDKLFRAVSVVDPDKYLNIIIAPGSDVLGIAVFPFKDRSATDSTKIDPRYAYRNAVLVNTSMFRGNMRPYDKYRTFTHEIGHWCGLLHPFDNITFKSTDVVKHGLNKLDFDKTPVKPGEQDQDFVGDLIADTAPQTNPVYGTVYDSVRVTTTWSGAKRITRSTPYAQIFEKNTHTPNFYNFMDYTDDAQMCMFTHLQVLHMIYFLYKFRPNFVHTE